MATFGYGRVSSSLQTTENQRLEIETKIGKKLDYWFEDHAVSGSIKAHERPQFSEMMKLAQKGDRIIFSRVDRISRRASDVLVTVENMLEKGIDVYILQIGNESLASAMGRVILGVFSIFAENDRLSIQERTVSGLRRTKELNNTILGKPPTTTPDLLRELVLQMQTKQLTQISKEYNISTNTLSKYKQKYYNNREALNEYELIYNRRLQQILINKEK